MSTLTVRKAIVAALRSALAPMKVYVGRVPQNAAMPYAVVASTTAADMARYTDTQRETTRVYVYSESASDVELLTKLEAVRAALHEQKLTLEIGHLAGMRVRSVTALQEVEEDVFTGIVTVETIHQ